MTHEIDALEAPHGRSVEPLPVPPPIPPEPLHGLDLPSEPLHAPAGTNFERLADRPRAPGEIPTRPVAIRNFCIACQGGGDPRTAELREAIRDCPSVACWLHPHRAGTAPRPPEGYSLDLPLRRREPQEIPSLAVAIMAQCRECHGWEADGHGSLRAHVAVCPARDCWLWPWRLSKLNPTELEAERQRRPA